jgi:hypothetical protein
MEGNVMILVQLLIVLVFLFWGCGSAVLAWDLPVALALRC